MCKEDPGLHADRSRSRASGRGGSDPERHWVSPWPRRSEQRACRALLSHDEGAPGWGGKDPRIDEKTKCHSPGAGVPCGCDRHEGVGSKRAPGIEESFYRAVRCQPGIARGSTQCANQLRSLIEDIVKGAQQVEGRVSGMAGGERVQSAALAARPNIYKEGPPYEGVMTL